METDSGNDFHFETGAAAQYWSWRNLHYSIAAWGFLQMFLIYLSFPETSHPGTMGIEKVARKRRFHIVWVNPLSSLWLLRSPNLLATVSAFFGCLTRQMPTRSLFGRLLPHLLYSSVTMVRLYYHCSAFSYGIT